MSLKTQPFETRPAETPAASLACAGLHAPTIGHSSPGHKTRSGKQVLLEVARQVAQENPHALSVLVQHDGSVALPELVLRRLLNELLNELLCHEPGGLDIKATAMGGAFVIIVKGHTPRKKSVPGVSSFFGNQTRFARDVSGSVLKGSERFSTSSSRGGFYEPSRPLGASGVKTDANDDALCPHATALLTQAGGYLRVLPGPTVGVRVMLPRT